MDIDRRESELNYTCWLDLPNFSYLSKGDDITVK